MTTILEPVVRPGGLRLDFEFTASARNAICAVSRRDGRHAVLLSWPAGVAYLPERLYRPGPFDAVVDHVASCPVYVDVRRLALFANRRLVIDTERGSIARRRPALRVRPATVPSALTGTVEEGVCCEQHAVELAG